jgi:hypothetical protein
MLWPEICAARHRLREPERGKSMHRAWSVRTFIPAAPSIDLWQPAHVMPTLVGIHVFVAARTVRRGWWAFAPWALN